MKEKVFKTLKYLQNTSKIDYSKVSYSQCGEDLIIDFIFDMLNKRKIKYLDIGAHHPFRFSNTAFFYNKGDTGVNIEPDPGLFENFIKYRKRDTNLNIGISDKETTLDFYVLNEKSMNSFSKEGVDKLIESGKFTLEKVVKIPVKTLYSIVNAYFKSENIDLLSMDVEGLDFDILKSIDYERIRPTVICVETVEFLDTDENKIQKKNNELIEFIVSKEYFVFADTHINTIFVDKRVWKERR